MGESLVFLTTENSECTEWEFLQEEREEREVKNSLRPLHSVNSALCGENSYVCFNTEDQGRDTSFHLKR
jgi:hypothetical protein